MKQKGLVLCSIFVVFFLSIHSHVFGDERTNLASDKLIEIIQVADKNKIEMESWTLYSRESWGNMEHETLMTRFQDLKSEASEFKWTTSEDKNKWKAVGSFTNSSITEKITILAHPHKNKMQTYFIYEVTGTEWDKQIEATVFPSITERAANFFSETPESFACITGNTSDKMEGVLYNQAERLLEDFSASKIEFLSEETFVSLSAYTEKWKNDIPVKDGAMNLQIALRQGLGGATSVTIGTPIITSEY